MIVRKTPRLLLLVAALLVVTSLVKAAPQAPAAAQSAALTDPMPVDPQITRGEFSNGVHYYVRANKRPEKRAELRLAIKAGSILEDDDQQGLAHLVEHMAFNGTENFPKHQVVSFLESLGMRFGADVNAYTSFDETVYMLTVPTDKPEALEKAFLILEDWAHRVTFDPVEVEKERGVVLEEWRLGRGAGARIRDKEFPILMQGSRYADRLPIGKPEIIQGKNAERLKKFYTDWYRPDLMAVVAVGDFDKTAVENLIKKHFGAIPAASSPRPRTTYDMPDRPGTSYAIATDKEQTSTTIEVDHFLPTRPEGTIGAYRQKTVNRLFTGMLGARFSEMAQKTEAPFLQAFAGYSRFIVRSKDAASLFAAVKEDGIERGLDALISEAERIARFGFTATELERVKISVLRNYERMVAEKENRPSGSRADEYIRNFLVNETLPSADDEYALHQRFVPQITLDEINKLAREWYSDKNRVIVVSAPDKPTLVVPNEAKLASVAKSAAARELTAYVDSVASATLLDAPPAPGAIASTSTRESAGITEWVLGNGAKVVLKPTTFRDDEVVFNAFSPGGTSLARDADYVPANTATSLVTAGGLGKFNLTDFGKVMTGKIASVNPFISELEEGLSGNSSKKDLEAMFQLIYLRFTQPRADPAAFTVNASRMKSMLANQAASPGFAFAEAVSAAMYGGHPRRRPTTAATVDEWDLNKSVAFYKDRFADASDFTFVFLGSFDVATIKPLVERYLGSLPSTRRKETWKDVGVRVTPGVVNKTVEKGLEPRSQTTIIFSGPFDYNQTQRIAINSMTHILQTRLLEAIREDLGGTYSITAGAGYTKDPIQEYTIRINFGSDPQRTDNLVARVLQEIEALKSDGPTEKQLNDEKEALLREFDANTKQNGYLLAQISFKYRYNEDPGTIWNIPDYYRKLDAAAIKEAARTYLNSTNRIKVTLVPEKKS